MAVSPQINNAEIMRIFIANFMEIRLLPVACVFIYWHKCLISENILYLQCQIYGFRYCIHAL